MAGNLPTATSGRLVVGEKLHLTSRPGAVPILSGGRYMPSIADLVESNLLRSLTDADTYDAGVALANRGAVELDELGPFHARARVEDGETFVVVLSSGLGKLTWSCSEPGGSRGALCRHCVAAAVETQHRSAVGPGATSPTARHPSALETTLDADMLVTREPAPTTQAEPLTSAVWDAPQPASPPAAGPMPRRAPAPDATLAQDPGAITGVHAIVFTPAVAEVRAFFSDVLSLQNVDAGDGWPIFALPPAELAVHAADVRSHELYLMCADIEATLLGLEQKGVVVRRPVREEAWGFVSEVSLPGGTTFAIYQPKHRSPPRPREPRL